MNIQTEQNQAHQEEATKEAEARAAERAEEIKRVREVYDANRNNAIEDMLDTFGVWPLREKTASSNADHGDGSEEGMEKEERKSRPRKYIQMTKDGARVAYGSGKYDLIELDWIGLDWIELDWIGLDWIGLDWIGLDW